MPNWQQYPIQTIKLWWSFFEALAFGSIFGKLFIWRRETRHHRF